MGRLVCSSHCYTTAQQLLWNAWHHLVCSRSFSSEPPERTCCLHGRFHELSVWVRGGKPFSYGSSAPPAAIPLHSSCCGTLFFSFPLCMFHSLILSMLSRSCMR